MAERWTCSRCSTENDPWVVGCSKCGLVRSELSVAGQQQAGPVDPGSFAAPETPTSPSATPSAGPAAAARPAAAQAQSPTEAADATRGPWTPAEELQAVPPPAIPLWRRIPLGWIVVGVLVFGGAIGGLIFNAGRGSSGEITKAGDLTASDLRVGDCFDLKDPSAEEIGDVKAVPCTTEHEYEAFFVGSMPGGDYPTEETFSNWVETNCTPAFASFIGKPYDDSQLDIFWLQPTKETWINADRSIQCAVYHPQIKRLTESLKGTAR
jgi:hypothetical protein